MSAFKISIDTADHDLARTLCSILTEIVEPAPDAATLFENGAAWRVEAYFAARPDAEALRRTLETGSGKSPPPFEIAPVPDTNWVAVSQAALPPVIAGRFVVHGSHDRSRIPRGPNAIEIDAGEAFGTAHHATTLGCLEAIGEITRSSRPRRVLDLGCGSGVLAIAAARALPHAAIIATDLDPVSIDVATANARANGVAGRIRFAVAAGLDHPWLRRSRAFDLVIANILAGPLIALAPAVARALRPGCRIVLSGILDPQAAQVLAAYGCAGFSIRSHRRIAGWSTLTLIKRS